MPQNIQRPYIKVFYNSGVGRQEIKQTQIVSAENPVFNERVQFDVQNDTDSVVIELHNSTILGTKLSLQIRFEDLKELMNDQTYEIKETFFNFLNSTARVRINFNYMFSKRMMLENEMSSWKSYLSEDVNDYFGIENYLELLQQPYKHFLDMKGERELNLGIKFEELERELVEKEQFKKKYKAVHDFEKKIIDKVVDKQTTMFMRRLGFQQTPWLQCTKVMMMVVFVLNAFAGYARPDFLTQITCVLAVYMLQDSDNIDRTKFRMLPVAVFLSIIYDIIFLVFLQNIAMEAYRVEGGMESSVKMFALYLSYVTLIFKPFVFLILWKVSYNFLTDIKQVHEAPRMMKLMKVLREYREKPYNTNGEQPTNGDDDG